MVCKLTKAFYGLKQAPRAWYTKLMGVLQALGFSPTRSDSSLLTHFFPTSTIFILIYVDDIIIIGSSQSKINSVISQLDSQFFLNHMGALHYFLGIQVTRSAEGCIFLNQGKYVQDVLVKVGMADCKSCATPVPSTLKLSATNSPSFDDPSLYRTVVDILQYLTVTRLEIAYCVNKVCQFMHAPTKEHW
ncbi:uncharacterized protein LOC107610446 [Arachis ipaensis]|uniref:uncharacterized protein LOC107610446 n=1 Tax=Arachis ipaensis TaxID=130454 RepID=UPI000A2B0DA3|nr:uncharacterized protein LOC107610446 [Arachis ipaensis]